MKIKKSEIGTPRKLILKFVKPYKWLIVLLFILFLSEVGFTAIQPLIMAPIINIVLEGSEYFSTGNEIELKLSEVNLNNIDIFISQTLGFADKGIWEIIFILCATYLAIIILRAVVETIGFYISSKIRIQSLRQFQEYVFGHLLSMSMGFFNVQRSGEIVSRLEQDTSNSINKLTTVMRSLATAPILILFYGSMLVRTNQSLMLIVGIIAALQWGIARLLKDRLKTLVRDEFDLIAKLRGYLFEIFQNIRVVKSFVAEDYERGRLRDKVVQIIPVHIKRAMFRHWEIPVNLIINGLANVSILIVSANELFKGNLSTTGFFLFLFLGRSIIGPISLMGSIYLDLQEMDATADRVFEIVQKQSSVVDGSKEIQGFSKEIHLKNVSFSYGQSKVLDSINLKIKQGQMIALVGPSGAGKSTISDLLMRFYDPNEGEILIDGVDLKTLKIKSYRKLFGVVAQENLLFNGTIAENIAYGRSNISRELIERSADIANASEFINDFTEGYSTMVGDRGIRLSGGQRQRVAIARAIAHSPSILVLDEATSSLDSESEKLVQSAIDNVIQSTTAIVVAHRLSTVMHADNIFVIDKGKLLDHGSHKELLSRSKLYRRLCELQFDLKAA